MYIGLHVFSWFNTATSASKVQAVQLKSGPISI